MIPLKLCWKTKTLFRLGSVSCALGCLFEKPFGGARIHSMQEMIVMTYHAKAVYFNILGEIAFRRTETKERAFFQQA
ncbi:hypothetical protein O9992_00180 [Vibrio lentus]|nr:hypothetical protein [Vibrio lentus]